MSKEDTYKRAEGIKELLDQIRERIVIEDFIGAILVIDTYMALVDLVLEETKNERPE